MIFPVAVKIWIAGLIGEDACPSDSIIMRPVIVTVDPEFRLKLFNNVAEVRSEGRRKRAALIPRRDRMWMGGVVSDHDSRAAVRYGKLVPDKRQVQPVFCRSVPWHEPAIVPSLFPIANEAMIIQRLAGIDHGWLRRPVQPVIGP